MQPMPSDFFDVRRMAGVLADAGCLPVLCQDLAHPPKPQQLGCNHILLVLTGKDHVVQLVKPATSGTWGMLNLVLWAVMHPSCTVRTQWDLYVLAVLFSVCIITPFVICFDLNVMPLSVLGASSHALL